MTKNDYDVLYIQIVKWLTAQGYQPPPIPRHTRWRGDKLLVWVSRDSRGVMVRIDSVARSMPSARMVAAKSLKGFVARIAAWEKRVADREASNIEEARAVEATKACILRRIGAYGNMLPEGYRFEAVPTYGQNVETWLMRGDDMFQQLRENDDGFYVRMRIGQREYHVTLDYYLDNVLRVMDGICTEFPAKR